ncbi:HyaD/HybD family hydrogenase maturation endopeptidase [Enterobacteriales bacterium SAP-6]|uniref:HyaD/HybD family hydrogenase maturation endopeptidase n=1 Tax=Acerihabitans arboris TaxID=2691583 RepID=A0A845SH38_9GAMM|nr:HyaD/HybD family hydrogenase maturation endopeptidase [Acerihabitans arboris]
MAILVLGIGNLLLSDEAVGVRVIEALERGFTFTPAIDILDGGTSGMELLETMSGRDHLIVADAVLAGKSPGDVVVLRDGDVPAFLTQKLSPHQLGLADALMALRLLDEFPRRLTLVGVEPQSLAMHIGLTDRVSQALEPALGQVIAALEHSGVTVTARALNATGPGRLPNGDAGPGSLPDDKDNDANGDTHAAA